MPLAYAGPARRHGRRAPGRAHAPSASSTSAISVRRRSPARARSAFLNACLTAICTGSAPGFAQYTLCCTETGGVVDDLIAYVYGDDDVFLVPNAANTAEVARLLAEAAPDGVDGAQPAPGVRRARRAGPAARRGCWPSWGCLPTTPTCRTCGAEWQGEAGRRLPFRLHRRARLRAAAAVGCAPASCGTRSSLPARCRAVSVRATRCGPRWAIRCTARTWPRHQPRRGPPRLGGRLEQAGVLGTRGSAGRAGRTRPGCCGGCGMSQRHRPARAWACQDGRPRSHQRHRDERNLQPHASEPASRWPCSAGVEQGDEVNVDVRGRRSRRPWSRRRS